jgi:vacuolar protein sorting-associated protein 13A/C
VPFAWEQYCREPQLELHVGRGHTSVRLDDLAASGAVHVPPSSDGAPADTLRYRMVADGPVKVLQLLPLHAPPVGQPLRSNYMDDGVIRLNLRLSLASFGLSLVDKHRMGQPEGATELLYLSALGTQLSYQASSGRATLSLLVRHLQVDNQLRAAVFPVLLRPSWSDAETRTHEEARAAGQRSQLPAALEVLVQRNLAAPGVAYYETVSLRLQTMEIMIDYQVRPARPRHAPRDAPLRYTVQLTQRCTL